ncbi:MAG: phenylalanine--tRNA ligase subunit alpha [Solirubrobacterales bacterium]
MLIRLTELRQKAEERIQSAANAEILNEIRIEYLGRKGEITSILRGLKDLSGAERAEVGKVANQVKDALENLLNGRESALKGAELERRLAAEAIDVTMPGLPAQTGGRHPLTLVTDEIKEIFLGLGFSVAEGPEVESDYYNFEALNFQPDHPARDMQDSFVFSPEVLLRTHTSPVQVRTMEAKYPELPVKIIIPGKVYRRDDDATHSPMFQQVEGLLIDKRVTFADLKGILMLFANQIFGQSLRFRFRPSFFPFVEPGAEMDVSCVNCGGSGCRTCKGTGWLEILGAGMVHPNVLRSGGYDPEEVTGFAFGMGVERIAMLKYGVNDLRLFFDNDMRFLTQF